MKIEAKHEQQETTWKDIVFESMRSIERIMETDNRLAGFSTGFRNIDRAVLGLKKKELTIVAARPGQGKCLGKGTQLLMYDGTLRSVEDIRVEDLLMGPDSKPRHVLSVCQGREMMYTVHQSYAMSYRVNESHILSLKRSKNEWNKRHGECRNISVREYLSKGSSFSGRWKGYKVPVRYGKRILQLHPYFLGIWLGDGASSKAAVTTDDSEVVQYLKEFAPTLGMRLRKYDSNGTRTPTYQIHNKKRGGSPDYKNTSLLAQMRRIGVIGNKHIPHQYLTSSITQRLSLLAGLLDSDGYYAGQYDNGRKAGNYYEITLKSEVLARDTKRLADSLGFRTSMNEKQATITSINYECKVFRVRIAGDTDRIPCIIPRKKSLPWKGFIDWRMSGIKVQRDVVDDYYGFELDGDGLFLLEDGTVTHNTSLAMNIAEYVASGTGDSRSVRRPVGVFSLEMGREQLALRMKCSNAGIDNWKLMRGMIPRNDMAKIVQAAAVLSKLPIYVDDRGALDIDQITIKARRWKQKHDIQLLVVDYLQLAHCKSMQRQGRQLEVSAITDQLKQIAMDLDIPVIALSQLSRKPEDRKDGKPMLSDLRESGAIEQTADNVWLMHRPCKYKQHEETDDETLAIVDIAKQRNGPTGEARLNFRQEFTRFEDRIEIDIEQDTMPI